MCGRYVSVASTGDLTAEFEVAQVVDPAPAPNWNTAPTQSVPGILMRHRPGEAKTAEPVRQLRRLRWGLVPAWAKTPTGGAKMINARIETLAVKPAFRAALKRRRLVLPAAGYYEWLPVDDGAGRVRKQPYYIHPPDGDGLLAFAGLYEWWHDPNRDGTDAADAGDHWLLTCTIITTAALGPLGEIHDRTPFVLPPDRIAAWLDPEVSDAAAIERLLAPTRIELDARPVSTAVNKVSNNGSELIAAVDQTPDQSRPLQTVGAEA
jgi:putative SOS response-associated peptidase YedK